MYSLSFFFQNDCTRTKVAFVSAELERLRQLLVLFSDFPRSLSSDLSCLCFLAQAAKTINTMDYTKCLGDHLLWEVYINNCLVYRLQLLKIFVQNCWLLCHSTSLQWHSGLSFFFFHVLSQLYTVNFILNLLFYISLALQDIVKLYSDDFYTSSNSWLEQAWRCKEATENPIPTPRLWLLSDSGFWIVRLSNNYIIQTSAFLIATLQKKSSP